jgi:2-methylthioadenine synthetase
MEILFEKKGRHQDQYIGRSIYNQSVFTKSESELINTIKNVKILNSTDFALESSI